MNARAATKVFFGCPTEKQEIAQAIIDELRNRKAPIEPVRWWDSAPQGVILHKIMEQLSSCAFSVIVFSDGEETIRNNCIFEAGIVAGMSELGYDRCFMIRDCDEALLPTDLGGVEYIDIKKAMSSEHRYRRLHRKSMRRFNLRSIRKYFASCNTLLLQSY